MSQTAERQEPGGYRLRVKGHLDLRWSAWFDDITLTRESDGTTSLSGAVRDQAELHRLLTKIRDLGITLISVHVIDPPDEATPIRSGLSPDPRVGTRRVRPAEISQGPQPEREGESPDEGSRTGGGGQLQEVGGQLPGRTATATQCE